MRNFKTTSRVSDVYRKDWPIADALKNPMASAPVLDGEWLQLDPTNGQAVRFTAGAPYVAGAANSGTVISFPVWAESGRYDVQVTGKVPLLYLNAFEAESKIFDTTGLYVGAPLEVADMVYPSGSGTTRRGLQLLSAATNFTVGVVVKVLSDRVRFIRTCC